MTGFRISIDPLSGTRRHGPAALAPRCPPPPASPSCRRGHIPKGVSGHDRARRGLTPQLPRRRGRLHYHDHAPQDTRRATPRLLARARTGADATALIIPPPQTPPPAPAAGGERGAAAADCGARPADAHAGGTGAGPPLRSILGA